MRLVYFFFFAVLCMASSAIAASTEVVIGASDVEPRTITMQAGDNIVFRSADAKSSKFNIQIVDKFGHILDKETRIPNSTISQKLERSGEYVVRCPSYPKLRMRIIVQ